MNKVVGVKRRFEETFKRMKLPFDVRNPDAFIKQEADTSGGRQLSKLSTTEQITKQQS